MTRMCSWDSPSAGAQVVDLYRRLYGRGWAGASWAPDWRVT